VPVVALFAFTRLAQMLWQLCFVLGACVCHGQPASSSSSSSSSPASAGAAVDPVIQEAAPPPVVEEPLNLVDATPPEDRIDPVLRTASNDDQRSVYLWTFPHTAGEGRATPNQFSRPQFAAAVVEAYERTGKVVAQWAVFLEVHPLSKSQQEATDHIHMVVETEARCRWGEIARYLRTKFNVFASVSTSSSRQSYWSAFAYLYAPSAKKTKEDIDRECLLSPGHEQPPQQLALRRQGIRRLQPVEVYETIVKHELTSTVKFFAFAARQHAAGDRSWVQYCMTKGDAKVAEVIRSARLLSTAGAQVAFQGLTHLQILEGALQHACICGGCASDAWDQILVMSQINAQQYCASVLELFRHGGGKGLNHFYVGEPNSGKTALTRPVLQLFGATAFVKPTVGTTFALQGVIGAKAIVWNDFYWPRPPMAWGDLLNVFDNEGFNVGVPKTDGQHDYPWNQDGSENVIAMLTSNKEVIYVADHEVDLVRTQAWKDRFSANTYLFKAILPKPDRRFKVWLRCTRCYAQWVHDRSRATASSGGPPDGPRPSANDSGRNAQSRESGAAPPRAHDLGGQDGEDPFGLGGGLDSDDDAADHARQSDAMPEHGVASAGIEAPGAPSGPDGDGGVGHALGAPETIASSATPLLPVIEAAAVGEAPSRSRSRSDRRALSRVGARIVSGLPAPLAVAPACVVVAGGSDPTQSLRELNLFLQRHAMEPARFSMCVGDAALGLWHCQAVAGGVEARGTGRGKQEEKRASALALLRGLQELAGSEHWRLHGSHARWMLADAHAFPSATNHMYINTLVTSIVYTHVTVIIAVSIRSSKCSF